MKRAALIALFALAPSAPAVAHPHVFVDVTMTVIYDGAAPVGVKLDWTYDEYFSLLLTTDLGIDLDGDLQLTADEAARLSEAVTRWPADFGGDLEATQNGQLVRLGAAQQHTAVMDGGIIRESHVRPFIGAADAPLTIQVYDPFYYVAYSLAGSVQISGGSGCSAAITPANLDAAYTAVEELLYGRPASDVGPDEEFPEVGQKFADTVVVTCAG